MHFHHSERMQNRKAKKKPRDAYIFSPQFTLTTPKTRRSIEISEFRTFMQKVVRATGIEVSILC